MSTHQAVIRQKLLKKILSLGGEAQAAQQLINQCTVLKLNEGDIFCRAGESKGVSYLAEGTVVARHNFGEGLEIYSSNLTCNSFVVTSLDNLLQNSRADYICLESGYVCYWPPKVINQFFMLNKDFYNRILQCYIVQLSIVSELGFLRSMLNKRDYAVLILLLMFSARVKQDKPTYQVSQHIMCNHTGMTRQYYSKLIGELEDKGIIKSRYKGIELINYNALREELSIDILDHFIESYYVGLA